jgi:[acyl-carrier-protein] S-malonyltransferase
MSSHTAFLFPGQGSETIGMGAAQRRASPHRFDHWLQRAEAASGLAIARLVTAGPAGALASSAAAQPALLAVCLAVAESAASLRLRPTFVAGHGVGEYAAAAITGVLTPDDAMSLVAERGRLIAAAERRQSGVMALIEGVSLATVTHTCSLVREKQGYVTLAQADAPRQCVISGNASAVAGAIERLRRRGATAETLPGRGAHNSSLMVLVQARLARLAATIRWRDARIPLVTAAGGRVLTAGSAIRDALIGQETAPLQWTRCMTTLRDADCDRFLELGPGQRLTVLARQHAPDAMAMAADGPTKLAMLIERPALWSDHVEGARLAS